MRHSAPTRYEIDYKFLTAKKLISYDSFHVPELIFFTCLPNCMSYNFFILKRFR